ncbi:unnamed protein product [Strongylus vulgaris]|uniref:Uncharacterized protein n=1 Tax=Strongylus vulgaris TaxID=40348 RepID=A0A3P7IBJ3_STRVU|nr:unnamed protein product [Strongylus vulgaris]
MQPLPLVVLLSLYRTEAQVRVRIWQPNIDSSKIKEPIRFWELVEMRPTSSTTPPPPPPPPPPSTTITTTTQNHETTITTTTTTSTTTTTTTPSKYIVGSTYSFGLP